jgi:hypothetical protein
MINKNNCTRIKLQQEVYIVDTCLFCVLYNLLSLILNSIIHAANYEYNCNYGKMEKKIQINKLLKVNQFNLK